MARVTGIGGVFFKAKSDSKKLNEWYQEMLGIPLEEWGGAALHWPEDKSEDKGITVWTTAKPDTDWFEPSSSSFMINYRVDDMEGMLEHLGQKNVEILKGPESHENGKFAWIMDPDGNKIELWEPMIWDDKNKS